MKETNKTFSEKDEKFILACEKVGVSPTRRQASKWRNKKGIAYKKGRNNR